MTSILAEVPPAPRRLPWATLASLALHGGLLLAAAFTLARQAPVILPPEPPPIAVEMVSPAEFAALQPVAPPPVLATQAPVAEATPAAPATEPAEASVASSGFTIAPDGTITATTLYAANLLQQPDMQRVRQGLRGFADSERLIQICNIEALEQIRRAAPLFDPDTLVAYAFADLMGSGFTLIARGGAFRSRRNWYGIAFTCTAAPGYEAVSGFEFKLGEAIPESEWEEHYLNAADADE